MWQPVQQGFVSITPAPIYWLRAGRKSAVWAALSVARGELPDASKTPCHRRTLMLPFERVKLYSSISEAIVTQKLSDVATCFMVPAHPEDTVSEDDQV
jgi:hypothetical protein